MSISQLLAFAATCMPSHLAYVFAVSFGKIFLNFQNFRRLLEFTKIVFNLRRYDVVTEVVSSQHASARRHDRALFHQAQSPQFLFIEGVRLKWCMTFMFLECFCMFSSVFYIFTDLCFTAFHEQLIIGAGQRLLRHFVHANAGAEVRAAAGHPRTHAHKPWALDPMGLEASLCGSPPVFISYWSGLQRAIGVGSKELTFVSHVICVILTLHVNFAKH